MGDFDPDRYLAEKGGGAFDPDAYLAQKMPSEKMGMLEAGTLGLGQGSSLGFGDELAGAAGATLDKALPESMLGAPANKSWTDLYRENRDFARNLNKQAAEDQPAANLAGNVVGGIASSALLPSGETAQGASLLKKAWAASKAGALVGGAAGLGTSEADLTRGDVSGALADSGKGAAFGAGTAFALPLAMSGARAAVNGVVKVAPEAQALLQRGVQLSLGQSTPRSWFNSLEQSAESTPVLGDIIKGQRQAGRAGWQSAVANEARAPGAAMRAGLSPQEHFSANLDDFDQAYAPIRAVPVKATVPMGSGNTAPLGDVLAAAAHDPNILATNETRQAVNGFLENQYSKTVNSAMNRPLTAGDLISLRSGVRSEIRNQISGATPDYATAKLLKNAEDAITASLEHQLPDPRALRTVDQQYGKLMRVGDAIGRSGDMPNGFTPAQLSAAVKKGSERLNYASGGGGPLRELAAQGRETLDTTVPPTGARLLTMMSTTPYAKALPAALAALGTTASGRAALLGETAPQVAAQFIGQQLGKHVLVKALAGRAIPILSEQAGENAP